HLLHRLLPDVRRHGADVRPDVRPPDALVLQLRTALLLQQRLLRLRLPATPRTGPRPGRRRPGGPDQRRPPPPEAPPPPRRPPRPQPPRRPGRPPGPAAHRRSELHPAQPDPAGRDLAVLPGRDALRLQRHPDRGLPAELPLPAPLLSGVLPRLQHG